MEILPKKQSVYLQIQNGFYMGKFMVLIGTMPIYTKLFWLYLVQIGTMLINTSEFSCVCVYFLTHYQLLYHSHTSQVCHTHLTMNQWYRPVKVLIVCTNAPTKNQKEKYSQFGAWLSFHRAPQS